MGAALSGTGNGRSVLRQPQTQVLTRSEGSQSSSRMDSRVTQPPSRFPKDPERTQTRSRLHCIPNHNRKGLAGDGHGALIAVTPSSQRQHTVHSQQKPRAEGPNRVWSLDFVADELTGGRRFRALTVVDVYTPESLAIEVGQSLEGYDVVRVLQQIAEERGMPQLLFCDNGSEFTSQVLDLWAYHNQVKIDVSRPGKPTDNAYVESFNGTLRAECLDAHWFDDLAEARQRIESWRIEYNASRPHRALGERTPNEFAREIAASRDLSGLQTSRKLTLVLV